MSEKYEFSLDEHFAPVAFQEINYFRERTFITAGSAGTRRSARTVLLPKMHFNLLFIFIFSLLN
jgi:hypothetical protein